MSLHINRRAFLTVVTGALAAPAVVFGIRPARAATTLTLGHGAAPETRAP